MRVELDSRLSMYYICHINYNIELGLLCVANNV